MLNPNDLRVEFLQSEAKNLALPAQDKLREGSEEMDPRLRGGDDKKGRPVPPEPSFPRQRESTDVRALFRASSDVIPAPAGIHLGRQDPALGFCAEPR